MKSLKKFREGKGLKAGYTSPHGNTHNSSYRAGWNDSQHKKGAFRPLAHRQKNINFCCVFSALFFPLNSHDVILCAHTHRRVQRRIFRCVQGQKMSGTKKPPEAHFFCQPGCIICPYVCRLIYTSHMYVTELQRFVYNKIVPIHYKVLLNLALLPVNQRRPPLIGRRKHAPSSVGL